MTTSERARAKLQPKDMPEKERPLSERKRLAGLEWARLKGIARRLSITKNALLEKRINEWMVKNGPCPYNNAQRHVKGSESWIEHLHAIAEAEERADVTYVEYEALSDLMKEIREANFMARDERRQG